MEIDQQMARDVLRHHNIELGLDNRTASEVATLFLLTGKTVVGQHSEIEPVISSTELFAEFVPNTVY